MSRDVWDRLLADTRAAYEDHPDLSGFAPFPTDIREQAVQKLSLPCAGYLARESDLNARQFPDLCSSVVAAGAYAHWRQTYKGTDIGADFMERFGCFTLIGDGGAFTSSELWAWFVFMPAALYYPWHHHPGEEMYMVLGGEARFLRSGEDDQVLHAGHTSFHASNQPHAMETLDSPVLALVVWRNGFETAPVLTK